jgi:hypothetical protein
MQHLNLYLAKISKIEMSLINYEKCCNSTETASSQAVQPFLRVNDEEIETSETFRLGLLGVVVND